MIPPVNPVTVIGEEVPVTVIVEPDVGVATTSYPVSAVPPLLTGAVNVTDAEVEADGV